MRSIAWILLLSCGCGTLPPQRFVTAPAAPPAAPARRLSEPPRPSTSPDGALKADALPAIERALQAEVEKRKLPALAVGVVLDGKLAWSRGFGVRDLERGGPVDENTVFAIGSVTKVFAGLSLLQLRDAGRLRLDDPAVRHLPELARVRYPTHDSPLITLRHLVTHSSGLPRLGNFDYAQDKRDVTEAEVLAALDVALAYVPGTQAVYSNLAVGLVGIVVSRLSGLPFGAYLERHVLAPLGMRSSALGPEHLDRARLATGYEHKGGALRPAGRWRLGAAAAAGGLYSTVADLARFVAFQLAAWPPRDGDDPGPLKRASVRESHLVAGYARAGKRGFGVNWVVTEDAELGHVVFHNGGVAGYRSSVWLLPQRGLGLIALTSTDEEELDTIMHEVLGQLARAVPESDVALPPAVLPALERLRALLVNPDPKWIAAAFTPAFLQQIPEADVVRFLEATAAGAGACRGVKRVIAAEPPGQARLELDCERGALEVRLVVEAEPPHRIAGCQMKPATP
jgi:CubicO group peptidase (beta-lactamase class C family)